MKMGNVSSGVISLTVIINMTPVIVLQVESRIFEQTVPVRFTLTPCPGQLNLVSQLERVWIKNWWECWMWMKNWTASQPIKKCTDFWNEKLRVLSSKIFAWRIPRIARIKQLNRSNCTVRIFFVSLVFDTTIPFMSYIRHPQRYNATLSSK